MPLSSPLVCPKPYWVLVLAALLMPALWMRADLVLTEIMYHPAGESLEDGTESLEFIELTNTGTSVIQLGNYQFSQGVEFVFPNGSSLQPGSFLLVAGDSSAVKQHYGVQNVIGNYTGQLSNAGETIRLVDPLGETVLRFRYGTAGAWPASADGAGHSLVLKDLTLDNDLSSSWQSSRAIGGSAGAAEPAGNEGNLQRMLIQKGVQGFYFKGVKEPSNGNTDWAKPAFETDNAWLSGRTGFGYSNNAAEASHLSTTLNDMRNNYLSVYARVPFQLNGSDMDRLKSLQLTMNYDDSFVVYLNGVRVGAEGVNGNPPAFNQVSNAGSDYDPQTIDLTSKQALLVNGRNWLAIQGHNVGIGNSSDFVMAPELSLTLRELPTIEKQWRAVIINEVFANGSESPDYVELYNPTDAPVDVGGMWLSDKPFPLMLYQIPTGSIIPAKGHLVIEASVDQAGFGLSSQGESIFLSSEDGSYVAASYAFGPMEMDMSLARFPDGGDQWFYQSTSTPGQANQRNRHGAVVLNEVMYHPQLNENAEFIEIRNISSEEISIGNWSLAGVNFQFPGAASLPGNGLQLIASDAESAAFEFGIPLSQVDEVFRGRLRNGGESLGLLDAFDVAVDWIDFSDSAPWPVTADGLGSSIERACWDDRVNAAGQWFGSPIGMPSPGSPNFLNDCPPDTPERIVISEFLYHAAADTEDESLYEFIKLQNISDQVVDLEGWAIAGSAFYLFADQTLLPAGGHVTVAVSPDQLAREFNFGGTLLSEPLIGTLPNGGGEIALIRQDGRLTDRVCYDDDFPWPSLADGIEGHPKLGYSLRRNCDMESGELPGNWVAVEDPTPHVPNPEWDCGLLNGPQSITLSPLKVVASTTPVISVQWPSAARLDTIQNVIIEYFVDDHETEGEKISRLVMRPDIDSQGAELREQYAVTLPALSANSVVRYRIRLQLEGGRNILSPSPERDAFEWHAYFVDPEVSTNQPNQYHLFLSSANWRRLHSWTNAGRVSGSQPNPTWNNEVPATFVSLGQVFDVTVRHQGSRWNRRGGSNISFDCPSHQNGSAQVRSWRVRFPSYRNWDGLDIIHLQKQSGWPQRISFKMFELAGVPSPRTSWSDLRINGCQFNRDAFQIERPGKDLVGRWYDEVGDLFKSQGYTGDEGPWSWGDARLIRGTRNRFSESERYEYTFNRKTLGWKNQPEDGKPDIVEPMIEALHAARGRGPQALRQWLSENFDVDQTLRYICTINYVGTFDDMFQNHFLYRKAEDNKWCMLPWDMDNTLGGAFGQWNANPFRGAEERRVGNVGNRSGWWNRIKDSFFIAYEQEFLSMFHQLNNTVHSPENLRPVIEAIAAEGGRSGNVNSLMNHIQRRHDYLNSFIEPRLSPPLLALSLDAGNIVLQWSEGRTDFNLEAAASLFGPWRSVSEGQNVRQDTPTSYTVLPNQAQSFFRLSR
ncbi:lamin tail domain-containing protein [Verrucomicrobia bacterium]|nr:lamin tail domain-containing protein [Verrucomicrobiota bacterium]